MLFPGAGFFTNYYRLITMYGFIGFIHELLP